MPWYHGLPTWVLPKYATLAFAITHAMSTLYHPASAPPLCHGSVTHCSSYEYKCRKLRYIPPQVSGYRRDGDDPFRRNTPNPGRELAR